MPLALILRPLNSRPPCCMDGPFQYAWKASFARDEFILAATAQNLRKMAKLVPMPIPTPA